MITIFDVADWFLSKEPMMHKKLQKLCYYFKAWGEALYNEDFLPNNPFYAWTTGPVNNELYNKYKKYYWQDIPQEKDNSDKFDDKQLFLLESVWYTYGDMSANALDVQTRGEQPWRNAKYSTSQNTQKSKKISLTDMRNYYRSVYREDARE